MTQEIQQAVELATDESVEKLKPAQQIRFAEIGRRAIVAQHPQIRSFMSSRSFGDKESLVRAVVTEWIKWNAIQETKASDEEL